MPVTIKVFFAFQFGGALISKCDRENAIIAAVKEANQEIEHRFPGYALEWSECHLNSGKQVGEQVVKLVSNADILIADISEFNLNVLFELGVAYGLQAVSVRRIVWLAHETIDLSKVPSDLRGLYIERYDLQSLRPLLSQKIRDLARSLISERLNGDRLARIRLFWGLSLTGNIDLVCSEIPEEERHYFADPADRNYLRYAKFADLDSLIYVRTRVAQLFPTATIRDFSPSEYFDTNTNGLIVIGGPPWNSAFREFQSQLPLHFVARPLGEDDPLHVEAIGDCFLYPTWDNKNRLLRDISVFAKVHVQADTHVFLLGGCLAFGVLGAARAFLDPLTADNNIGFVQELAGDRDFVVVFESSRIGGFLRSSDFPVTPPLVVLAKSLKSGQFEAVLDNTSTVARYPTARLPE
jgi:hypothetical protein